MNAVYKNLFKESLVINLWYNGSDVKEAVWLSSIFTGNKFSRYSTKGIEPIKHFQKVGLYTGWIEGLRLSSLPPRVLKNLKEIDFFKDIF